MRPVKPSEYPTLLNERQVSELLTISVKTLQNWRSARRELPFIKLGGRVRYVKAEVLGYIAEHRHAPSAPVSSKVDDDTY
jgi:predicted DNA-binding transcriptional regulator AlpA